MSVHQKNVVISIFDIKSFVIKKIVRYVIRIKSLLRHMPKQILKMGNKQ